MSGRWDNRQGGRQAALARVRRLLYMLLLLAQAGTAVMITTGHLAGVYSQDGFAARMSLLVFLAVGTAAGICAAKLAVRMLAGGGSCLRAAAVIIMAGLCAGGAQWVAGDGLAALIKVALFGGGDSGMLPGGAMPRM